MSGKTHQRFEEQLKKSGEGSEGRAEFRRDITEFDCFFRTRGGKLGDPLNEDDFLKGIINFHFFIIFCER